jgi:hypothetical protein
MKNIFYELLAVVLVAVVVVEEAVAVEVVLV